MPSCLKIAFKYQVKYMLLCCENIAEIWTHKGYPNEFVWHLFHLFVVTFILRCTFHFWSPQHCVYPLGRPPKMSLHHLHFESFHLGVMHMQAGAGGVGWSSLLGRPNLYRRKSTTPSQALPPPCQPQNLPQTTSYRHCNIHKQ